MKMLQELLQATGLFFIVFMILHFSVQNFRVDGRSMHPSLVHEQHVIVSKLAYTQINASAILRYIPLVSTKDDGRPFLSAGIPEYGDLIAFTYPLDPSLEVVKRVVGLPGDIIEIKAGEVIRNGHPLQETYVVAGDERTVDPVMVREDFCYVLGDNRIVSNDSRNWGLLHQEYIIGRAWVSYWPWERFAALHSVW